MSDLYSCVVCGRSYIGGNHKCPAKTVKRKDKEAKQEPPLMDPPPTYNERLETGFRMLQQLEVCV